MREREGGELLLQEAMEGGRDGESKMEREMEVERQRKEEGGGGQQKQLLTLQV